jgi:hypothetical protein
MTSNRFGLNSSHKHAAGLRRAAQRENVTVAIVALCIIAALLLGAYLEI